MITLYAADIRTAAMEAEAEYNMYGQAAAAELAKHAARGIAIAHDTNPLCVENDIHSYIADNHIL